MKLREAELLRRIREHGFITISDLAAEFGVVPSTVRRHLDVLAQRNLIRRRHGAVEALADEQDVPYTLKERDRARQKVAIGTAIAHRIDNGQRVLIDSGSTTLEVARALRYHSGLTIVTNDIRIADVVAANRSARLVVIGGELLPSVYTLLGQDSIEQIRQLSVDVVVMGADALTRHGVTNTNGAEIPMKRAMLASGPVRFLVADSSKFGQRFLLQVCALQEFTLGVTDNGLDPMEAATYPIPIIRVSPHREPGAQVRA